MSIGSLVTFGNYYQESEKEKTPIEWIVLNENEQGVLLLSQKALDLKYFDSHENGTDWEKSKIRTWLNEDFFNEAFDGSEKSKILKKRISTTENISKQQYAENFKRRMAALYVREGREPDNYFINFRAKELNFVDQGKDTLDKVFLLSASEVDQYLDSEEKIKCKPTAFAQNKPGVSSIFGKEDCCSWWLRSMGTADYMVCFVDDLIEPDGHNCRDADFVRPAIWVDFNKDSSSPVDDRNEYSNQNMEQKTVKDFTVFYKTYAHSTDGKYIDESRITQEGYEEKNRQTLFEILNLSSDQKFSLNAQDRIGETYVEGKDPTIYFKENDERDERIGKAIQYAIEDLRMPISSLRSDLFSQFYSDDNINNLVDFAMMIIDAILLDGGSGRGGNTDESKRLVAKAYRDFYDRGTGKYANSFSFSLQKGMLEDSISELNPSEGDYELSETVEDFEKEFILSNIVPALYFSLTNLTEVPYVARNLYGYTFELA